MKKLLIITTMLIVLAMLFDGMFYKDAPLMWLASTSLNYAYMRIALLAVLLTLLVTSPPRSQYFRIFLAGFASALCLSTVWLSYWYAINLLDAVIFIEVAIIFMIEALESSPEKASQITFRHSFVKKK
jgi:hypothetical protein